MAESCDTAFYLIGGGDNASAEMRKHRNNIAQIAKQKAGAKKPNILYIPTAHHNGTRGEPLKHYDYIRDRFRALGCNINTLLVGATLPEERQTNCEVMRAQFEQADLVYWTNGDTRHMMNLCLEHGIDQLRTDAIARGVPQAGSSAGAISAGKICVSDSECFDKPDSWEYLLDLKGFGEIDALINAHHNQGVRNGMKSPRVRWAVMDDARTQHSELPGIGIDEYAAIRITRGILEVVAPYNADCIHLFDYKSKRYQKLKHGNRMDVSSMLKLPHS